MTSFKEPLLLILCLETFGVNGFDIESDDADEAIKKATVTTIVVAVVTTSLFLICLLVGICCYCKRSKITIPGRIIVPGNAAPGVPGIPQVSGSVLYQPLATGPPPNVYPPLETKGQPY